MVEHKHFFCVFKLYIFYTIVYFYTCVFFFNYVVYLSFSSETYYIYEDEKLFVELKLNKASDEEIIVYLNDVSVNATSKLGNYK